VITAVAIELWVGVVLRLGAVLNVEQGESSKEDEPER
jgi:hypothetical protein